MKKLLGFLSIAIFSSTCGQAADMQLLKSTPADGSVSDEPPSAFVLQFSQPSSTFLCDVYQGGLHYGYIDPAVTGSFSAAMPIDS